METVKTKIDGGKEVNAIKIRRLPETTGSRFKVEGKDKLDVIATTKYGDSTRFWHIADANTELEANKLIETTGREIKVPDQ